MERKQPLFLACLLSMMSLISSQQNLGQQLNVKIGVVENSNPEFTVTCKIEITNNEANAVVVDRSIVLHLCIIHQAVNGTQNATSGYIVKHIEGCYHTITSPNPFVLEKRVEFEFKAKNWFLSETDFMPNWYISTGSDNADALVHQLIHNTATEDLTEFVKPFTTLKQYKRLPQDTILPLLPIERYEHYSYRAISLENSATRVLPSVETFNVSEARLPVSEITERNVSGLSVELPGNIRVDSNIELDHPEAYKLVIDDDGMVLYGQSKGIMYGAQTVDQLLQRSENKMTLPVGSWEDKPRFDYRGFMLDISRNFHTLNEIKMLLPVLRRYKLNRLHLHLSDDEGWRLHIEGLDELTTVGSRTCFNVSECNLPQLGHKVDEQRGQFLSKADYIDIVKSANMYGITIVPEFDMPGHGNAAIRSMESRYRNPPLDDDVDYRLSEESDNSRYISAQYFTKNAINACLNSTYNFISKLVRTVKDYHDEAGVPLTLIHLGGDEVPSGAWDNSTACAMLFDKPNSGYKKVDDVEKNFFRRIGTIASENGLDLAFWEDGLYTGGKPFVKSEIFPDSINVYAMWWQSVWEWKHGSRPHQLANNGFKVIQVPAQAFYMDHPAEPHSKERGYYWAKRYVSTKDTFSWKPDDVYSNIEGVARMGDAYNCRKEICAKDSCPELKTPENMVGIAATLFSETIRTSEQMQKNMLPRLLMLAERAWHKASWEDDNDQEKLSEDLASLITTIGSYELPYLYEKHQIHHHVAAPGINLSVENGVFQVHDARTEFPGQTVEYRKTETSNNSWLTLSTPQTFQNEKVEFRTISDSSKDTSIIIRMAPKELQSKPKLPTAEACKEEAEVCKEEAEVCKETEVKESMASSLHVRSTLFVCLTYILSTLLK